MQQFGRDHRITGDSSSRLPLPPRRFMETTQATKSGQGRPSYAHAPRNHHSRVWKVKRRLKLAYRHHYHIHGDYAPSEAKGQKMVPTPPLMQFMKYVPSLLLALIILKYQGKPHIIFWEDLVSLLCFIAATCVYWLIVEAMKQMTTLNRRWIQLLIHAALASAILSTISLVSMFLPYPVSLLPGAVLLSFPLALALLYVCSLFLRGIECGINKVQGIYVWARGSNLMEKASLPV